MRSELVSTAATAATAHEMIEKHSHGQGNRRARPPGAKCEVLENTTMKSWLGPPKETTRKKNARSHVQEKLDKLRVLAYTTTNRLFLFSFFGYI